MNLSKHLETLGSIGSIEYAQVLRRRHARRQTDHFLEVVDAHCSYDCCLAMRLKRAETLTLFGVIICCSLAEKPANVSSPNIIIMLMDDVSSFLSFFHVSS